MKVKSNNLIDIFDFNNIVICQKFIGETEFEGITRKSFQYFTVTANEFHEKYEGSKSNNITDVEPCDFKKLELLKLLGGGKLSHVYPPINID